MDDLIENLKSEQQIISEQSEETTNADPKAAQTSTETESKADAGDGKKEQGESGGEMPWGREDHTPAGVRKRFGKLTAKIREAEERVGRYEAMINGLVPKGEQKMPTKEDFLKAGKSEEEYLQFVIQSRVQDELAKYRQTVAAENDSRRKSEEISAAWEKNSAEAREELKDYDDVVSGLDLEVPRDTLLHLATSPVGMYVTYTIAKREDLQDRIAALPPDQRHAEVLRIETEVKAFLDGRKTAQKPKEEQQPQEQKPRAPKPIKASAASLDPATSSVEDWLGIN